MQKTNVQKHMQTCLNQLGIPLTIVWTPKPNAKVHGRIEPDSKRLFVYDVDPELAWNTFFHEVCEFKFREVTFVYRQMVNALIETLEKVSYRNKEQFLEFMPRVTEMILSFSNKEKEEDHI